MGSSLGTTGRGSGERPTPPAVRPLSLREFALFRDLVHDEAGIALGPSKMALVSSRLTKRLRELALPSFEDYYRYVQRSGADELVRLLDAICTNETRFFREIRHFEVLEQVILPRWREEAARGERQRIVRAWSAASSTGEEPYTLAMVLLAHLPASEGWSVEVLGTDLSTKVLRRAREGTWSVERAGQVPKTYLQRFMLRGTGANAGLMRASPELAAAVRFERLNLNDASYPVHAAQDLVFCRNVLIYFDEAGRRGVIERLTRHVAPRGYLVLGHAEALSATTPPARAMGALLRSFGPGTSSH